MALEEAADFAVPFMIVFSCKVKTTDLARHSSSMYTSNDAARCGEVVGRRTGEN